MNFYFNKPLLAKQLPGYMSYFVTGIALYLNFELVLKNKIKLLIIAATVLLCFQISCSRNRCIYPFAFGTVVIIVAYSLPFLNNFGEIW